MNTSRRKERKMKREDKIEWLKTHFFADFTVTRERVFNELSDMQPMFCICGGLATGLHENCFHLYELREDEI